MKLNKKEKPTKNPRWGSASKSYGRQELRTAIEVLRESLMEIEAISLRMEERKIDSVEIPGGAGSEAYNRAEAAIGAWARGLRAALHDRIKQGNQEERVQK